MATAWVMPVYFGMMVRVSFGCLSAAATHSFQAVKNLRSSAGLASVTLFVVQNAPTGMRNGTSANGLPSERKAFPCWSLAVVRNGSCSTIASSLPAARALGSSAGDMASARIDFGSPPAFSTA